jgi:hypothetical protein
MLLFVGVIIALLALAWAGVKLDHIVHVYPGQFYMGVFAALFIATAAGVARHRGIERSRVPLQPQVPPLPKAIPAAPVLTAIAAPQAEEAENCAGPGCGNQVDDDPWLARLAHEEEDSKFCSEACVQRWEQQQAVPGNR